MTPLKRGSCVRPASLFKMQVELCFFDTGSLTNCNDGQKGTGWNLKRAAEDAADEYLAGVSVRNGLITLTSRGISLNGKDAFSLILVPEVSKEDKFGALKWKIDASSTCLAAGLCEDEKTRNARQEEKAVKEDKDPLATARRGSSATLNGIFTFLESLLSRPLSRAPPPERYMPLSTISE